jgi:exodeoxyribonuclease-3
MKIATLNVNEVKKRLANLLGWLRRARPDVACLQELKAQTQFRSRQSKSGCRHLAGEKSEWRRHFSSRL